MVVYLGLTEHSVKLDYYKLDFNEDIRLPKMNNVQLNQTQTNLATLKLFVKTEFDNT
jgi:hypothetical protein